MHGNPEYTSDNDKTIACDFKLIPNKDKKHSFYFSVLKMSVMFFSTRKTKSKNIILFLVLC